MSQSNKKKNKNVTVISSWDDGSKEDLKIARLLRKYNLNGIFFLSNKNLELSEDEIKVLSQEFQIGGHTYSHTMDMKLLDKETQKDDIEMNKDYLENLISKKLEWFCYPRGRFNEDTIKVLKELGFKYARTTLVGNNKEPVDNFRVATSVHVYPTRQEYNGQNWLSYAKLQYELAKRENGIFHVWGHGWEIEKFGLWGELEQLFKYIKDN